MLLFFVCLFFFMYLCTHTVHIHVSYASVTNTHTQKWPKTGELSRQIEREREREREKKIKPFLEVQLQKLT